jgi:choline dehydrogenase-like flavoprotein
MPDSGPVFDAIVIGTGFAGAVTACRLTQAGQRICVLERGRRYEADDLPVYPSERPSRDPAGAAGDYVQPDFSRGFWQLGQGLWDVRDLGDVVTAQAAGYGGGSLLYANVHLRAPAEIFEDGWPEDYRRELLDPYYDLVAYMLDVKPMPAHLNVPKRDQLRRVASRLGDDAGNPRLWHFDPPLAVNFPAPGEAPSRDDGWQMNRWQRLQRTCDLRGDCCFGCTKQAKNTLDLNYLAIAEDAETWERPAPDIRTLAEAVSIERVAPEGVPVYQVEYLDHLFGGRRVSVLGKAVFLCAGAVNTTELLMRCRQASKLKFPREELGTSYQPNADTIAAVFDCDEPQEVDRGPTITSSLLYTRDSDDPDRVKRGGTASRDWFLIQDGGMPTALEPLLGVLRSPLWARRNRYREGPTSRDTKPGASFPADLPFQNAVDVLSGLTRSALRPGVSQALALGERARCATPAPAGSSDETRGLLPAQLEKALKANGEDLLAELIAVSEPLVDRLLVDVAESFEKRFPDIEKLIRAEFPVEDLEIGNIEDLYLARRVLRLAVQLMWGSEGGMVENLLAQLRKILVPQGGALVDRADTLLKWLLSYRLGDGHTALLLSMGRDSRPGVLRLFVEEPSAGKRVEGTVSGARAVLRSAPIMTAGAWGEVEAEGTLLLGDAQGEVKSDEPLDVDGRIIGTSRSEPWKLRLVQTAETEAAWVWALRFQVGAGKLPTAPLRAELPGPLDVGERAVQERILRDIAADGWDGELRTNPAWNSLGRRMTVHSQGGCPMPGVTRANGEVIGCDGLYVMDAAAFPTSVGVNPSATIAAIAELKIERYIRTLEGLEQWRADQVDDAKRWSEEVIGQAEEETGRQRIRRDELDPLRDLEWPEKGARRQSAAPRHQPVGIRFEERMEGFHAPSRSDPTPDTEPYRRAERDGIDASAKIEMDLEVEIADLALFLESHRVACQDGPRRGAFPRMEVTAGRVELRPGPNRSLEASVQRGSHLQLRDPTPGQGREERILRYELQLLLDGRRHILLGNKYIRDDPGVDLWQDTSTLYFDLLEENGGQRTQGYRGIARLPAKEFLETQIASFVATHTEDPARQAWALTAFGRYFLGNLMNVYVPDLGRVSDIVKRVAGRTHV